MWLSKAAENLSRGSNLFYEIRFLMENGLIYNRTQKALEFKIKRMAKEIKK